MAEDNRKTVLIIDDDEQLHERAGEFLRLHGFACHKLTDSRKSLVALASLQPDIVLLDVMMADEDGFSVLLKIREISPVPVIMLTARGQDTDRIIGLELGADDYLPKPFNPHELLARIGAVLRRVQAHEIPEARSASGESAPSRNGEEEPHAAVLSAGEVAVDSYVLDTRRQTLSFQGNTTSLSTGEMCIIHAFLTHAGTALTRDQLMNFAFGSNEHATERSVDVHISRIRALLRDIGDDSTRIRTVWGVGYCWFKE